MESYNLWADALNKFSQLTPWVQAVIGIALCAIPLAICYFLKEIVAVIAGSFRKKDRAGEDNK